MISSFLEKNVKSEPESQLSDTSEKQARIFMHAVTVLRILPSLPPPKSLFYYSDMCRMLLWLSFIAELITRAIVWDKPRLK